MGYCTNCGKEVSGDMVFCTECGHRLVAEEKALPEAKSKDVPRQIQNILARDELVEKDFHVKGRRVYATDRRLLELEGKRIRDFDYAHISSVEYSSRHEWGMLVFGIILFIVGIVLSWIFAPAGIALGLIGLILIIVGARRRSERIEANVVGVSDPIKYEGSRQTLDSLLQLIRQKQLAGPAAKEKETKEIDSVEAIRKLAELRDQGILTQEEFEEKKRKLL